MSSYSGFGSPGSGHEEQVERQFTKTSMELNLDGKSSHYKPPGSSPTAGGPGSATGAMSSSTQLDMPMSSASRMAHGNDQLTLCANDPTQLATAYCPELDMALCNSSFEQLRLLPAFRNTITLVPLHVHTQKRRKDPETGEPFTMYDVDLEEPIPTVAKLVGKSKDHHCIAIDEAASHLRTDMKDKLSVLKDQLSNARIAANHVDKLTFLINQEVQDRRANVEQYFTDCEAMLQRKKERVLDDLERKAETKMRALNYLSKRLPRLIETGSETTDKISEATVLNDDLELLFKRKELELWMRSMEQRMDIGGIENERVHVEGVFRKPYLMDSDSSKRTVIDGFSTTNQSSASNLENGKATNSGSSDLPFTGKYGRSSDEMIPAVTSRLQLAMDGKFDVYINEFCNMQFGPADPEVDRCWTMVESLLGYDSKGIAASKTVNSFDLAGQQSLNQKGAMQLGGAPTQLQLSSQSALLSNSLEKRYQASTSNGNGFDDSFGKQFGAESAAGGGLEQSRIAQTPAFGPHPLFGSAPSFGQQSSFGSQQPSFGSHGLSANNPWTRADFGHTVANSNVISASSKQFLFDPNFCQSQNNHNLVLRNNNREVIRKSAHARSAICMMNSLLNPGEEVRLVINEQNLFLSGSAWVGVTAVRSLATLGEHATYIDLESGDIKKEGTLVHREDEWRSLCDGDEIVVKHTNDPGNITFDVNGRQIGRIIKGVDDMIYPFVNVLGKVLCFKIQI